MTSRYDLLKAIKDVQKNYPDLDRHQMDEYRCRYYGDIIDLYNAYTHCLEREILQLNEAATRKEIADRINIDDTTVQVVE